MDFGNLDSLQSYVERLLKTGSLEDQWKANFVIYMDSSSPKIFQQFMILLSFLIEAIKDKQNQKIWIWSIIRLISKGFSFSLSSTQYFEWLQALKRLLTEEPYSIVANQSNEPNIYSIIASFCMLNYLGRFTMINDQDPIADKNCSMLEILLVKVAAKKEPRMALFPLGYIASHVMGIFGGPINHARSMASIFRFLEIHFSVNFSDNTGHGSTVELVNEQAMAQWRDIMLTIASDKITENIEAKNIINDILFVDLIFSKGSSLLLTSKSTIEKKFPEKQSPMVHISYLQNIYKLLSEKNQKETCIHFAKSLIIRESMCKFDFPECLKSDSNLIQLLSSCGSLTQKVEGICFFEQILIGFLELRIVLESTAEKFVEIGRFFDEVLRSAFCTTEAVVQLWSCISSDTMKVLSANLEFVKELILVTERCESKCTSKESHAVWGSHLIYIHQPTLAAFYYSRLFQQSSSDVQKLKFLSVFEQVLDPFPNKDISAFQDDFQNFLKCFQDKSNLFFRELEADDLVLIYFDVLNVVEDHLRSLFHVKIHIQLFLDNVDEMEGSEDGEDGEEGAFSEALDDLAAAKLFYTPLMEKTEANQSFKFYRDELNKKYNNILLFTKIFDSPPIDENVRKRLVNAMLERWNLLAVELPGNVFRVCIEDIFQNVYPASDPKMLDYVMVEFIFFHSWALQLYMKQFLGLLQKNPEDSNENLPPLQAVVAHFKCLKNELNMNELIPELVFLNSLTKEAILRIHDLEIPIIIPKRLVKNKKSVAAFKRNAYTFMDTPRYPKKSLLFLRDCIYSSPKQIQEYYLQKLISQIKLRPIVSGLATQDTYIVDYHEILLFSMLLLQNCPEDFLDSVIAILFDQHTNGALNFRGVGLSFGLVLLQDYFLTAPATAKRLSLISSICATDFNSISNQTFNAMREMVAINSEVVTIANKLLETLIESKWSFFCGNEVIPEMMKIFSSNSESFVVKNFLEKLENTLKKSILDESMLFLNSYSNSYAPIVKNLYLEHFRSICKQNEQSLNSLLNMYLAEKDANSLQGFKSLIIILLEGPRHSYLLANVNYFLKAFTHDLLLNYLENGTLTAKYELQMERFCQLLSDWIDQTPELVLYGILEPETITYLLSVLGNVKMQYILYLLYKVYHTLEKQPDSDIKLKTIIRNDVIWSAHITQLGFNCRLGNLTNSFLQISSVLVQSFLPHATRTAMKLASFIISMIDENDQEPALKVLGGSICNHEISNLVFPKLKSWIVTRPCTTSKLQLLHDICVKNNNVTFEPHFYKHLTSQLRDINIALQILRIFQTRPSEELIQYTEDISLCLQHSHLNEISTNLLISIHRLVLTTAIEKLTWFKFVIENAKPSVDMPCGVQALVHRSLTKIQQS